MLSRKGILYALGELRQLLNALMSFRASFTALFLEAVKRQAELFFNSVGIPLIDLYKAPPRKRDPG
jgi:hypothetical protein